MTYLNELFSYDGLAAEIADGRVIENHHPVLPLTLFTYSRTCQYDNHWNSITTKCRGLVVEDNTNKVVAHCLPKFFSAQQHENDVADFLPRLPEGPFELTDKLDGSYGTVFYYADEWHVASKGSFTSEQALWATEWIRNRDESPNLDPNRTYVVEIIYPENRIVVDYLGIEELILITAFEPDGEEVPRNQVSEWEGMKVAHWNYSNGLSRILWLAEQNKHVIFEEETDGTINEGWVIRYENGLRAKVKIADYVRLHHSLTQTSARTLWKYLVIEDLRDTRSAVQLQNIVGGQLKEVQAILDAPGGAMPSLLENVPDEFDTWVQDTVETLKGLFYSFKGVAEIGFMTANERSTNRKEFYQQVQGLTPSLRSNILLLLDGKENKLREKIWKDIYPGVATPFKEDAE